jgi:predicted nucleic acid-binding protein
VTTDEVLVEVLAYFSSHGPEIRKQAVENVRDILTDPNIRVVPQSRETFMSGLALYETRLDKGYSLTDCSSMKTMIDLGIVDVLTNDDHFVQEGFNAMFRLV